MAFAVHIDMKHCTSCNNCVVACPVDACGIFRRDLVLPEMISLNGTSDIHDVSKDPVAGYGDCVQACPYGVIRLAGCGNPIPAGSVQ